MSKPYSQRLAAPRIVNFWTPILDLDVRALAVGVFAQVCICSATSDPTRAEHDPSGLLRVPGSGKILGPCLTSGELVSPQSMGWHSHNPFEPCPSLSAAYCSGLLLPRSSPPFCKVLSFFGVRYDRMRMPRKNNDIESRVCSKSSPRLGQTRLEFPINTPLEDASPSPPTHTQ